MINQTVQPCIVEYYCVLQMYLEQESVVFLSPNLTDVPP